MREVEHINPYREDKREKKEQVREMFDSIAPAYDFMNRAMTFGIDRLWRRKAVKMLCGHAPREILDIATGTGDLAIQIADALPEANVTGIDLSKGMVEIGKEKVAARGLSGRVSLEIGDCLALKYPDSSFDCVTCAYGVRNFQDLLAGYKEMYRVMRPGGLLLIIELSAPTSALVKPFYKAYTKFIIPTIGRVISKDNRAYSYLPESIAAVPSGESMTSLLRQAGFSDAAFRRLTFGTCTIYTGVKR